MARIAYSYQRFSNQEQARGDSLRRQQALVDQYIAEHGLILDKTLTDRGVSAYKGKNARQGALKTFLDGVESGDIPSNSILICESLDRISRNNIYDALDLFLSITRKGVTIVTLTDGQPKEYGKSANPMQLMECLFIFSRANEESARKGERVKAAYDNKVEQVKRWSDSGSAEPGKPPIIITSDTPTWIDVIWEDKKSRTGELRLNERKVKTIKKIIDMYISGVGLSSLAKELNESKTPTITNTKNWGFSYINTILKNRALYGALEMYQTETIFSEEKQKYVRRRTPTGTVIENYFPPIISKDDFDYIQSVKKNRSGRKGRKGERFSNLFTGLVVCGECGGSMRFVSKGKKGKSGDVTNLVCANASIGVGCTYRQIQYGGIEDKFFDTFKDIPVEDLAGRKSEITIQISKKQKEVESLKAELADTEEKISNVVDAIAEGLSSAKLREKLSELETRSDYLERTVTGKETELAQRERENHNNKEKFKEILDRANEEGGTYYSRSQINEALKRYIHFIAFYPLDRFAIIKTKSGKDISFDYEMTETGMAKRAWDKHLNNTLRMWRYTLPEVDHDS